ncbi:hypothetical protein SEUCBS139899_005049 [Sporothrix eucalyptigena]|uniref:Uncharacterized protein n=1 Tax=Sporothrix eucalyptigena TaxID=1812306 RepID=A0ABP0BUF2_9PEZI
MDFSQLYSPLSSMTPWDGGLSASPVMQPAFCSCSEGHHHDWNNSEEQLFLYGDEDKTFNKHSTGKTGDQEDDITSVACDIDGSDSNKENEDPAKGQSNDSENETTSTRDSTIALDDNEKNNEGVEGMDEVDEEASTRRMSLVDLVIREYALHFAAHLLD